MAKDTGELKALRASARNRVARVKDEADKKVKKARDREKKRIAACKTGAFAGALLANLAPQVAPSVVEFLDKGLTENISVGRDVAVGIGLTYAGGESNDAFMGGALSSAGGALVGRGAGRLMS